MAGNKKKKRKDTVGVLSGLMAGAIALAVVFYGVVAYATIVKDGGIPAPSETQEETGTEAPEGTETEAPGTTEAPTQPPLQTVSPDQVTVETKPVSDLRLIQQLATDRVNTIGEETGTEVRTYPDELPVLLDADGRSAAANEVVRAFSEAGTEVTAYCAGTGEKKTAFVFFAGAGEGCTEAVAEILKTYGIRATFFVSHYYAAHSADCVKKLIADGHEIGNYSYSCPAAGIVAERSLADIMADAGNEHNYVRTVFNTELQKYCFPAGSYSLAAGRLLTEMGYEVCFPTVLAGDADPEKVFDRDAVLADLTSSLHPGAVYAFHLENGLAADVLTDLISYAALQGYTITQLD